MGLLPRFGELEVFELLPQGDERQNHRSTTENPDGPKLHIILK
jgi:hypothetical protein